MARKVLFIIVLFALTIQQYSLVQSLPPIVIGKIFDCIENEESPYSYALCVNIFKLCS